MSLNFSVCLFILCIYLSSHLQLRKALPDDQRPQIIEHADGEHQQPVEVEVLVRIDHCPRLFPVPPPSPRRRLGIPRVAAFASRVLHRFLRLRNLAAGEPFQEGVLSLQGRFLKTNKHLNI